MKQFVLVLSFLSVFISYSQVTVKQPLYYYVSKWQLEDFKALPVGRKILFEQNCTTKLPAKVPTGIIFFENVYHQKERFSISVEFKDTIVASVTYYISAKQVRLLNEFGYSDVKASGSATKGQWTYTLTEPKRRTTIVGDRKKIVVIQTL